MTDQRFDTAMDTSWDQLRAVVYAMGVHACVFGLLFVSLLWQHAPRASATKGTMIEATLVSATMPSDVAVQVSPSVDQQQTISPPQPTPAPTLEDAAKPSPPDVIDQDTIAHAATRNPDQEQPHDRPEQLAPNDASQASAAAPVSPQTPTGSAADGMDLETRYLQAIKDVANQNWHHDGVPENVHCNVQFKQSPGGEVFDVVFLDCPLDPVGRTSVLEALKRTPLPYAGFESVFLPQSTLDLCYPEEACF